MKAAQAMSDKLAISLSMACAIHCLALPLILALLPSLAALQLNHEAFHAWMLAAVIPSSIYALTLGCKQHRRMSVLSLGGIGLICLILAVVLGEARIGEYGEKVLTLVGAAFVALGHFINYRWCSAVRTKKCACPGDQTG